MIQSRQGARIGHIQGELGRGGGRRELGPTILMRPASKGSRRPSPQGKPTERVVRRAEIKDVFRRLKPGQRSGLALCWGTEIKAKGSADGPGPRVYAHKFKKGWGNDLQKTDEKRRNRCQKRALHKREDIPQGQPRRRSSHWLRKSPTGKQPPSIRETKKEGKENGAGKDCVR